MEKRRVLSGCIGVIFILTALFAVSPLLKPAMAKMKPVELSLSLHFPGKVVLGPKVYERLASEIEKATNGLVKTKIYYAQTLLKTKDAYNGVVNGIADITYTQHDHTLGQHPFVSAFLGTFLNLMKYYDLDRDIL